MPPVRHPSHAPHTHRSAWYSHGEHGLALNLTSPPGVTPSARVTRIKPALDRPWARRWCEQSRYFHRSPTYLRGIYSMEAQRFKCATEDRASVRRPTADQYDQALDLDHSANIRINALNRGG